MEDITSPSSHYTTLKIVDFNPSLSRSEIHDELTEKCEGMKNFKIQISRVSENQYVAYIEFARHEDAEQCMERMSDLELGGLPARAMPEFDTESCTCPTAIAEEAQLASTRRSTSTKRTNSRKHIRMGNPRPTYILFVGSLDEQVMECDLRRAFESFGFIVKVNIRQRLNNPTKFAFIHFFNADIAVSAKLAMDRKYIGRTIPRLGFYRPWPTDVLWIGGIGPWTNENEIKALFLKYGKIDDFLWPRNNNYCFIVFRTVSNAMMAHRELNGSELGAEKKRIHVDFADTQRMDSFLNKDEYSFVGVDIDGCWNRYFQAQKREPSDDDEKSCSDSSSRRSSSCSSYEEDNKSVQHESSQNGEPVAGGDVIKERSKKRPSRFLCVYNLDSEVTEDELRIRFEPFGFIMKIIMKESENKKRRSAVIHYFNLDMAVRAKREMADRYVGPTIPHLDFGLTPLSGCLWLGGIGTWTDESELRKLFGKFGEITCFQWPAGKNFAYIIFSSKHETRVAFNTLHGMSLGAERNRIYLEYANEVVIDSELNNKEFKFVGMENDGSVANIFETNVDHERDYVDADYRTAKKYNGSASSRVVVAREGRRRRNRSRSFSKDSHASTSDSEDDDRGISSVRRGRVVEYNRKDSTSKSRGSGECNSGARSLSGLARSNCQQGSSGTYVPSRGVWYHQQGNSFRRGVTPQQRGHTKSFGDRSKRSNRSSSRSGVESGDASHDSDSYSRNSRSSRKRRLTHSHAAKLKIVNRIDSSKERNVTDIERRNTKGMYGKIKPLIDPSLCSSMRPVRSSQMFCPLHLDRFPVLWSGAFVLKSNAYAVNLYFLSGNVSSLNSMLCDKSGSKHQILRITQRLSIDDPPRLVELGQRMESCGRNGCSFLVAVPAAVQMADTTERLYQRPLSSLCGYLREKECAAVVFLPPDCQDGAESAILHAFPPCDFVTNLLLREAPELVDGVAAVDHLLIVVLREDGTGM